MAGILSIELGKEIYERTGLPGKPIRSGGRKHGKERFCMPQALHICLTDFAELTITCSGGA